MKALGIYYEEGRFVKADLGLAYIFFSFAAENGDLVSRLGRIRCLIGNLAQDHNPVVKLLLRH